jgi:uncharacterized protein involved in exopolysaccharide biosynthesis
MTDAQLSGEADQVPAKRPSAEGGDEINFLDLLVILAKYKRFMVGIPILAGIVAAAVSLTMTEIYTGRTTILPPTQSQSASSALVGQLGALLGGAAGTLGLKNPADIYVGMLKSRTIADAMIDRFGLMKEYGVDHRSDARVHLGSVSSFNIRKDGLITVDVEDPDARRAAALANGYIEELLKLSDVLAVTEASQRRLFYEGQLKEAKANLLKAELAAKGALEQGGLAMVNAEGASIIQTSAALRAQITAKEVEIAAMRGYATEQNPQLNKARQELAALREQVAKLERGDGGKQGSTKDDAKGVRNVALLRDVKYREALFELMARQYELAKLDEAHEGGPIQVLDKAVVPDRRSRPRRTLIVLLSVLGAGILSFALAIFYEGFDRARKNPRSSKQMAELSRNIRWR